MKENCAKLSENILLYGEYIGVKNEKGITIDLTDIPKNFRNIVLNIGKSNIVFVNDPKKTLEGVKGNSLLNMLHDVEAKNVTLQSITLIEDLHETYRIGDYYEQGIEITYQDEKETRTDLLDYSVRLMCGEEYKIATMIEYLLQLKLPIKEEKTDLPW